MLQGCTIFHNRATEILCQEMGLRRVDSKFNFAIFWHRSNEMNVLRCCLLFQSDSVFRLWNCTSTLYQNFYASSTLKFVWSFKSVLVGPSFTACKAQNFFLFAQKMFHEKKNKHEAKCSLNYAATLRMNILFQHSTTEINPKVI